MVVEARSEYSGKERKSRSVWINFVMHMSEQWRSSDRSFLTPNLLKGARRPKRKRENAEAGVNGRRGVI
jgi:hypothetical protein